MLRVKHPLITIESTACLSTVYLPKRLHQQTAKSLAVSISHVDFVKAFSAGKAASLAVYPDTSPQNVSCAQRTLLRELRGSALSS
jgi:hypothetical protein